MPTLKEIGDSEAVDNRYIDKLIFYVEGDDDQNLFSKFFFQGRSELVEVKQPPGLEGGFSAVINRVASERPKNSKIFGILDGEALLAIGEIALYRGACNGADWIWLNSKDGIVLFPCWEIENALFNRILIVSNLYAWLWKHKGEQWDEHRILRFLLCEIFRLTEIAAFNCTLHQTGMSPIRAETKTQLDARRAVLTNLYAESEKIESEQNLQEIFEEWRQFFRNFLGKDWNRERWYDELVNRVDGKALLIRIRARLKVPDNFLGMLAKDFMTHSHTKEMIDNLLEQATDRAV